MPKRQPKADKNAKPGERKQYNVGLPAPIAARLDEAAEALGTDGVGLIRRIIHEKILEYERYARDARGDDAPKG